MEGPNLIKCNFGYILKCPVGKEITHCNVIITLILKLWHWLSSRQHSATGCLMIKIEEIIHTQEIMPMQFVLGHLSGGLCSYLEYLDFNAIENILWIDIATGNIFFSRFEITRSIFPLKKKNTADEKLLLIKCLPDFCFRSSIFVGQYWQSIELF